MLVFSEIEFDFRMMLSGIISSVEVMKDGCTLVFMLGSIFIIIVEVIHFVLNPI